MCIRLRKSASFGCCRSVVIVGGCFIWKLALPWVSRASRSRCGRRILGVILSFKIIVVPAAASRSELMDFWWNHSPFPLVGADHRSCKIRVRRQQQRIGRALLLLLFFRREASGPSYAMDVGVPVLCRVKVYDGRNFGNVQAPPRHICRHQHIHVPLCECLESGLSVGKMPIPVERFHRNHRPKVFRRGFDGLSFGTKKPAFGPRRQRWAGILSENPFSLVRLANKRRAGRRAWRIRPFCQPKSETARASTHCIAFEAAIQKSRRPGETAGPVAGSAGSVSPGWQSPSGSSCPPRPEPKG